MRAMAVGMLLILSACSAPAPSFEPQQPSSSTIPGSRTTTGALLYASDPGTGSVLYYAFPGGTKAGGIGNLNAPAGLCVDRSGNVWIADWGSAQLVKYARASRKHLATLNVYGAFNLLACAVDPSSGNLAATSIGSASGGAGVWLFIGAKGQAKSYTDANLSAAYFCGYDGSGNLFVDGLDPSGAFVLFELPAGGSKLEQITLSQTIVFPGGVEWDGQYVAVGDQEYGSAHESAVYRLSISGSTATVKGTTVLKASCDVAQFAISGGTLAGPDACKNDLHFYKYPAGGSPAKTVSGLEYPIAAAISP